MNDFYLKRIFLAFVLFYFPFYGANGNEGQEQSQTQISSSIGTCNYLKRYLRKTEGGEYYLSLKEKCQAEKAEATECCSNPNACNGLARDLAHNIVPIVPGLASFYSAYRTSKDDSLSHEEAISKMCDVNNKIAAGAFLSQLGLQASTAFEKTCGDKIKDCEEDCHDSIDDFRRKFTGCFDGFVPRKYAGSVDDLINYAKGCANIDNVEDYNDSADRKNLNPSSWNCDILVRYNKNNRTKTGVLIYPVDDKRSSSVIAKARKERRATAGAMRSAHYVDTSYIDNLDLRAVYDNRPDNYTISVLERTEVKEEITKKDHIADILLYAKAYQKSSTLKDTIILTENSNDKDIINCRDQKNRVVTERKGPGAPISPPQFNMLCKQVVAQSVSDVAPPQAVSNENPHTGSFAGGKSGERCSSLDPRSSLDPLCHGEDNFGVVPDGDEGDDDFKNKNRPEFNSNIARFSSGFGGGGFPGGGGSSPGGGGGGFFPDGGGNSYGAGGGHSYGGLEGSDSFAGGGSGGYASAMGGGGSEPYPYRQPSDGGGGSFAGGGSMPMADSDSYPEDPYSSEGGSIFQTASQRIQQFCSDHNCVE